MTQTQKIPNDTNKMYILIDGIIKVNYIVLTDQNNLNKLNNTNGLYNRNRPNNTNRSIDTNKPNDSQ